MCAISASWRISTVVRRPRPSVSSTIRARTIRSAKCTMALRRWTSWFRSRSAALRFSPPLRAFRGATTASRSSILPDTLTLRPKWSALCAFSTARSLFIARSAAFSPSPSRSGVSPRSIKFRRSRSSTRWTASAPTSTALWSRCALSSRPTPYRWSSRSARPSLSRALSTSSR